MTYGWAILIIAVVLGALFQLGVFNAGTFAPRAPPGACQVFRPNGPGSVQFINLEGVCNGELPQYVGVFSGSSSSDISIPDSASLKPSSISVFAWVEYPSPLPTALLGVVSKGADEHHGFQLGWDFRTGSYFWAEIGDGTASFYTCGQQPSPLPTAGSIHQIGMTYDGSTMSVYFDGKLAGSTCSPNVAIAWSTDPLRIDSIIGGYFGSWPFIANVQIYNTSLSANEVQALYLEGIGGAPIRLQNLAGWWPLNGNANDYSGNNNNGVPNGVTYTNQWSSGYTPP